jgi:GNAT superfamily N-acetyltransferase
VIVADAAFVEARTTVVRLRDGATVRIRPIVPGDKQHLIDGFGRLSEQSRYRRFLSPMDDLSPELLRQLTEIDYTDHFAWIAFSMDLPGHPGLGVARYVRVPGEAEVAEAAVTVVDDFQRRGLGTLLLQALGAVALENGIKRFRGYALADNRAIRELTDGASITHEAPGMVRIEVDLPAQAEELRSTPMYDILRAVARGEGPLFRPPGEPAGPA